MRNVNQFLNRVNVRKLSNNTQRVLYRLLKANGSWLPRSELVKDIPSATTRIRDLRKAEFGSFEVECVRGDMLGRNGATYYYRLDPTNVTTTQVAQVIEVKN